MSSWNDNWDNGISQDGPAHDDGYNAPDGYDAGGQDGAPRDGKCFSCGEEGHRKFECPNTASRPPMSCHNCGEEGHSRKDCTNSRKIDRSNVADMSAEDAWGMIEKAAQEEDADDAKEGVEAYVKALNGEITFRELQQAFINKKINLWLIATERSLIDIFTNMDLQGNMDKKYTVSYRFSDKPQRPREIDGWPQSQEEILNRLDDAGVVVDSGKPKCLNCGELGHISKHCSQEKITREVKGLSCYNCGVDGHRVRDCTEPRKVASIMKQ